LVRGARRRVRAFEPIIGSPSVRPLGGGPPSSRPRFSCSSSALRRCAPPARFNPRPDHCNVKGQSPHAQWLIRGSEWLVAVHACFDGYSICRPLASS
jgi:hypothetical protein